MQTFIIELTNDSVRCIVQLLHLGILQDHSEHPFNTLVELATQASGVNKDPEMHGVYANPLEAPRGAVEFASKLYIPIV